MHQYASQTDDLALYLIQRLKLSDPACETLRLQTRRPSRVRYSAWLG